jgi:two-component system sensor histidine kinase/response regulator
MVTAYGREEVLKRAEETAFANVLIKPVTPSMLFDSVVQALNGDQESQSQVPAATPSTADLRRLHGTRVLLVEDNELNREVALGLLEDAHLCISQAENGLVAVQMIEENDYDLVLMDMQMPVLDGVAATMTIRSNPRFRSVPIIAMTANAMAGDREKCLQAGMNDYVTKPIDPDKLFDTLRRWIPPVPSLAVTSEATPPASAPPTAASPSLVIPGIDTATALRRTGGNRKRYESLLARFADSQSAAPSDIQTALATEDPPAARRIAHSLKGASANLGANSLAEEAAKVEEAIESGRAVAPALAALSQSLSATIAAIRAAVPAESPVHLGAYSVDSASVSQPLARLKRLLETDDGEASDVILEVRPQLSKILTAPEIEALISDVGNFAYGDALNSLSKILARLSLTLE